MVLNLYLNSNKLSLSYQYRPWLISADFDILIMVKQGRILSYTNFLRDMEWNYKSFPRNRRGTTSAGEGAKFTAHAGAPESFIGMQDDSERWKMNWREPSKVWEL